METGFRKTNKLWVIFSFILFFIVIIVALGFVTYVNNKDSIRHLDFHNIEKVKVDYEDYDNVEVKLPYSIKTNEPYKFKIDLSKYEINERSSLAFGISYSDFYVYADGKEIFSRIVNKDNIVKSGGSTVVIVDLPLDIKNSEVLVKVVPKLKSLNHSRINEVYFGSRSDIIIKKFVADFIIILLAAIMIFVFILMFILLIFYRSFLKKGNYNVMYLSLIGFLVGVYFLPQVWIIKFLLYDVNIVLYVLEYTSIVCIPVPIIMFLRPKLDVKYKTMFDVMIYVDLVFLIAQHVLTISSIIEFKEMLWLTHLMLATWLVLTIIAFFTTNGSEFPEKKKLTVSAIFLFVGILIPLAYYLIYKVVVYKSFMVLFVFVFIVSQLKTALSSYVSFESEKMKVVVYKEMALIDPLTKLANRRAYNKFVEEISEERYSGWIISIDLNDLKYVNDTYGHKAGDELIIEFSSIISKEVNENPELRAFRIGGDEFVLFFQTSPDYDVDEWIDMLKEKAADTLFNVSDIFISFAAGAFYYDAASGFDFMTALVVADERMYKNKKMYNQRFSR